MAVVYQAALQTSRSWSVARDCSGSPRNYHYKRYYQPGTGRYLSVDPRREAEDYSYSLNDPLANIDPLGLFSLEDYLVGTFESSAGFLVGGAVTYIAVATLPAWALTVAAVGGAGYGGFILGKTLYEVITGEEWAKIGSGGRELCDEEISRRLGNLTVELATLGLTASPWGRAGSSHDARFIRMKPGDRIRHELGLLTTSAEKFAELQHLPPSQRGLSLLDIDPGQVVNTIGTGATSIGRLSLGATLAAEGRIDFEIDE